MTKTAKEILASVIVTGMKHQADMLGIEMNIQADGEDLKTLEPTEALSELRQLMEGVIETGVPIFLTKDEVIQANGDPDQMAKGTRYYLDQLRAEQREALNKILGE